MWRNTRTGKEYSTRLGALIGTHFDLMRPEPPRKDYETTGDRVQDLRGYLSNRVLPVAKNMVLLYSSITSLIIGLPIGLLGTVYESELEEVEE